MKIKCGPCSQGVYSLGGDPNMLIIRISNSIYVML